MEKKFLGSTGLAKFLENLYDVFSQVGHTHTKSQITDFPTIPTKVSQLTNDSGFVSVDTNTTYTLSKSGATITLTGSDGSTQSVDDLDTIITVDSALSSSSQNPVQNKVINESINNIIDRLDSESSIDIDLHNVNESNPNPINADSLGGKYENELSVAKAADADTLGGKLESELSVAKATDADTLGGVAAIDYATNSFVNQQVKKAAPRNLLDNSDFTNPVNQRGQTSYSGSTYNIDRWRTFLNDNVVTVDNGCIRQTGTQLLQNLDANVIDKTKTYTLAACKVDGTIRIISGTFANQFSNAYLSCYIVESTEIPRCVLIESDGYKWAALYEGEYTAETLPEYQPKGYAAEISECRRYFLSGTISIVHNLPKGGIRVDIPLAQPMRIDPTFTLPNKKNVYNNNAATFTVEYSWKSYRNDRILIAFTSSSTSDTTEGYSYIAEIDYQLSADL